MIALQTVIFRLVIALLLGSLIGLERESGERAAGIRTHALVALGSCLIMIVSAFGFADILGTHAVVLDPSRIAAQVVSGIGFLGAGTILLRKEIIKGLTTAATIWIVAAIGLACGSGLLLEAGVATLLTMLVLVVLRPIHTFFRRATTLHVLHIEAEPARGLLLPQINEVCRTHGLLIEHIKIQAGRSLERIDLECRARTITTLTEVVQAIRELPEVQAVQLSLRRGDLGKLTSTTQEERVSIKEPTTV